MYISWSSYSFVFVFDLMSSWDLRNSIWTFITVTGALQDRIDWNVNESRGPLYHIIYLIRICVSLKLEELNVARAIFISPSRKKRRKTFRILNVREANGIGFPNFKFKRNCTSISLSKLFHQWEPKTTASNIKKSKRMQGRHTMWMRSVRSRALFRIESRISYYFFQLETLLRELSRSE